jgi:small subunit ribosomal protein S16
MGKKRQPVYKVVAADVRSPRDGRFIESIGLYNPKLNPSLIDIDEERALYWLNVGAQPTDTVKNLLTRKGILLKRELAKQGLSEEQIAAKVAEWEKMNEARIAARLKKEKVSKKKKEAKASAENTEEAKPAEKEEKVEESAAEVKGATSEDTTKEEEKKEE